MSENKTIKITISESETNCVINALDFYMRIWLGQYNEILNLLRGYRNCRQLDDLDPKLNKLLIKLRNRLLPELSDYGFNASHGIFSSEIDFRAGVAYDIQQVMRYKLAYFKHPSGGYSIDFTPPMFTGLDPYIHPVVQCERIDNEIYEIIEIEDGQREIIETALKVQNALYEGNIKTLFSYYTNDEHGLVLAEEITSLLKTVDIEIEYNDLTAEIVKKFV